MAVLLGLVVAACFGTGDFFGGLASRRVSTLTVLGVGQVVAVTGAVVAAVVFGGDPSARDLAFGAAAGTLTVIALGCLYQGLALGRMGIVAPITAVIAACIPVGAGLLEDERPSNVALVGVGLAIVAAGLIAHEHDRTSRNAGRALALALAAGTCFGSSLVLYAETSDASEFWPVVTGRTAALALVAIVLLVSGVGMRLARPEQRIAIGAGLLDVTGTVLLLVAVRAGLQTLVAPVAALGPAFTVGWAWGVLHEPVARLQLVGLGLGLVGLPLIAIG